jgi:hypothetical protein
MKLNNHPAAPEEMEKLHAEGYFVREHFFAPHELDEIERVADGAVAYYNENPRDAQDMYSIVSRKDGIIFVNQFMDESGAADAMLSFSLQPRIAEFARSVAGPRAAHHCYQLVYKYPQFRNPFPWHQDHIHTPSNRPFYNMWIALSDMSVENGCLRVLPGVGLDTVLEYHDTPYGKSCWPLDHPDQGVPMEMRRGSIFMITSHTLHSSGGNYSDNLRKAMLMVFIDQDATVFTNPVRTNSYS